MTVTDPDGRTERSADRQGGSDTGAAGEGSVLVDSRLLSDRVLRGDSVAERCNDRSKQRSDRHRKSLTRFDARVIRLDRTEHSLSRTGTPRRHLASRCTCSVD